MKKFILLAALSFFGLVFAGKVPPPPPPPPSNSWNNGGSSGLSSGVILYKHFNNVNAPTSSSSGRAVCVDPTTGAYYFAGLFSNGNMSFGTVATELKATNTDIYIAYFSSTHNVQWALSVGLSSTSSPSVSGCYVNPVNGDGMISIYYSGSITVNGTTYSSSTSGCSISGQPCNNAIWLTLSAGVVKSVLSAVATNGNVINTKSYFSATGEVYVAGSNVGPASVAGKSLSSSSSFEGYLVKLPFGSSGAQIITTSAGSGASGHLAFIDDVSYDSWSNLLLIGGQCISKSKLGNTAFDCGSNSAYLAALNPSTLAVVAVVLVPAPGGYARFTAVVSDGAGRAIAQGQFRGTGVVVGSSTLVNTGGYDTFEATLDLSTFTWISGNQGQSSDGNGVGLVRDLNGNIWGTSTIYNSANFNGTLLSVGPRYESALYRILPPNTYAGAVSTVMSSGATIGQTRAYAISSGGSANRAVILVGNAQGETTFGTVNAKSPYITAYLAVYVKP